MPFINQGDLDDGEQVFLIDPCLAFRIARSNDQTPPRLIWADPEDDSGSCGWEFLVDGSIENLAVDLFEETLFSCMFERVHSMAHGNTKDAELEQFIVEMKNNGAKSQVGVLNKKAVSKRVAELAKNQMDISAPSTPGNAMSIDSVHSTPRGMPMSISNTPNRVIAPTITETPGQYNVFTASNPAQLYQFDINSGNFVPTYSNVIAEIKFTPPFVFHLIIRASDKTSKLLALPLAQEMNPVFHKDSNSFVWVTYDVNTRTPLYSELLKFEGTDGFDFNQVFSQGMYETLHLSQFAKVSIKDQEYITQAYEDVEMSDAEAEEEESEEEEDIEMKDDAMASDDKNKNSHLAIGYKNDRSFVVRGNRIGVFKNTDSDLEFSTTINNVRTMDGKSFTPSKVMLHQQGTFFINADSCMLLKNPADAHTIYKMDLEYGKVIDEWKADENITIDEMAPEKKYSQLTTEQTLIGMNGSSLFQLDPRLAGNKIVSDKAKFYASKNQFSAMATTGNGELAVGSSKGEIRLFDRLGINAKTLLPGLGDPIIGMDTTDKGKYILATCKTYLIVIDTEVEGEAKSGFYKSMGQKKPVPKRLQLKPEHVAWMGTQISFTPARFNTIEGQGEESFIVTSSGPFVISWNFKKIKEGHLSSYTIKQYNDTVVADNFKYGQNKNIIVALKDNVEMISKSRLQTPTKMLQSRSSIVNSPY